MATCVIEGTVSELRMTQNDWSFKVCGIEGYAIRQMQGKDYVYLNVLCPPSQTAEEAKKPRGAIVVGKEERWTLKENSFFVELITCAVSSGKRICFELEESNENDYGVIISDKYFKLSSVTLLAE